MGVWCMMGRVAQVGVRTRTFACGCPGQLFHFFRVCACCCFNPHTHVETTHMHTHTRPQHPGFEVAPAPAPAPSAPAFNPFESHQQPQPVQPQTMQHQPYFQQQQYYQQPPYGFSNAFGSPAPAPASAPAFDLDALWTPASTVVCWWW